MEVETIGETAGKIWKQLGTKGQTSLKTLARHVGSDQATTQLAVGWLAREGKVRLGKKGEQIIVALTETEAREFERTGR